MTTEQILEPKEKIRALLKKELFFGVENNNVNMIKRVMNNDHFNDDFRGVLSRVGSEKVLAFFVQKGLIIKEEYDKFLFTSLNSETFQPQLAQAFIDNGLDPDHHNNPQELSPLQELAVNGKKDLLLQLKSAETQKNFFSDGDEFDNFAKFSKAKALLGLAYSEHDFPIASDTFKKLIRDYSPRVKGEKINSELIEKIIDGTQINLSSGNNIEVIKASWENHAAYFVIESDFNKAPLKLSYCDGVNDSGNSGNKYKFGEYCFDLSLEKVRLIENDGSNPTEKLKIELEIITSSTEIDDYEDSFNLADKLSKIFGESNVNQQNRGNSAIESYKYEGINRRIRTKPQKRGNCTIKSFNIVLRSVLNKIDPEKEEDNREAYKKFKRTLIKDNIRDLVEVEEKTTNKDKFWYSDLCDTSQRALNKYEKKLLNKKPEEIAKAPNKSVKIVSATNCFGFGNSSRNVR